MTEAQAREVVGPGMRKLLLAVFVLFAILVVDSVYLGAITFLQWLQGVNLEDVVYQSAFLAHLALGFAIVVPAIVYAVLHLRRAIDQPNRLAVRLGLSLFATALLLLASGIALTRGVPIGELRHPLARETVYWLHVASPFLVGWLFVLHRLAGRSVRWRVGGAIAAISLVASLAGVWLAEPRDATPTGEPEFFPSLARTTTGRAIPAEKLMRDAYCAQCHGDVHAQWKNSAHRFASFNNPAYLFSVRNTRRVALERDGDVTAARFCAGCHDPVPLFSGAFDDPQFDDESHPTAHAGITCVACHAIEQLGSPRGNSDYVIAPPEHYPFSFSENPFLSWVNGLLIKGKPAFHKHTFMKPLHRTAEFCGTCHKVHLPEQLNKYRWLRGQNHYDSFLLSGVSGHGVQSFYYPEQSVSRCSECHMPLAASSDFGAAPNDESGVLTVHGHHFPAANTALPHLLDLPADVNEAHRAMLEDKLRVDLFAIRRGIDIDAPLIAPLRPELPALIPGKTYVLDVVIRTLGVGHLFTEGTADSNEVWLDVSVVVGDEIIGRSGGRDADGEVDPWSHFVNAYVLDRNGNRIDRRNAEDIFTKLYDHQIPPGAADVVHYAFRVPETATAPVEISVSLRYRKFDTTYLRLFQGDAFMVNDLPITTIATDAITLPVTRIAAGTDTVSRSETGALATASDIPAWQRWNDYGIGLFRKPDRGALRQAEGAFVHVATLGRAEGDLNLARVLIREGRLDEAAEALRRAASGGAYPWSVAWFSGLVDMQNGELDAAIDAFTALVETRFAEARARGFDFSLDYRLRNTLALALFERAKLARSSDETATRLRAAADQYAAALEIDPENVTAHYGLAQIHARLGERELADHHRAQHEIYRRDDNAHDRAVAAARRRDAAANHASEAVVIHDLQRPGANGLAAVP